MIQYVKSPGEIVCSRGDQLRRITLWCWIGQSVWSSVWYPLTYVIVDLFHVWALVKQGSTHWAKWRFVGAKLPSNHFRFPCHCDILNLRFIWRKLLQMGLDHMTSWMNWVWVEFGLEDMGCTLHSLDMGVFRPFIPRAATQTCRFFGE